MGNFLGLVRVAVVISVISFSYNANAKNIFSGAYEFWTSPEVSYLFNKYLLMKTPNDEAQAQLFRLSGQLRAKGLPTRMLNQAIPNLDLWVVGKPMPKDDDSMGGAVPFMMYEHKYGISTLRIPIDYFSSSQKLLGVEDLDANMIAKLYHELTHLYIDQVASKDLNDRIGLTFSIISTKLRQKHPELDDEMAEDVANEILAHDVEYTIEGYIQTLKALTRRKAKGQPMTEAFFSELKKRLYSPEDIESKGYSNFPGKNFETRMEINGRLQKMILEEIFENRLTGDIKKDFAKILN